MRAHFGGMNGPRRHIAPVAGLEGLRLAAHDEGHFALKDDMRCFHRVRVIGVDSVRPVFPHINMAKAFPAELSEKFLLVHAQIVAQQTKPLSGIRRGELRIHFGRCAAQTRLRPFRSNGGSCEKGVPSSGEKIATSVNYSPGLAGRRIRWSAR